MKRLLKITAIVVVSIILLLFIFISPILKYVIESNSEEWTGRKIKIESLWLNIFTGSIHIKNLELFELKSEKVFCGIGDFKMNIEMLKLLSGAFNVSQLAVIKPVINISQRGEHFNFDDLVKRFATEEKTSKKEESAEYLLENISVESGCVNYSNMLPAANISIVDINAGVKKISNSDSLLLVSSNFGFKTGGKISSEFQMNNQTLSYRASIKSEQVKFSCLIDYVKDYLKIKSIEGALSSDIVISGNMNFPDDIAMKGNLSASEFALTDTSGEKLFSFASFNVDIDSLNTKSAIYDFKSIGLNEPFIQFAMFNDGYNFDRIMTEQAKDTSTAPVEDYSNIFKMMADMVREISRVYQFSDYSFDQFAIHNGKLIFTDYTLEDKFLYVLDSLNIDSKNVSSTNDRIFIEMSSRLNKSGLMAGSLSVSPDGISNMDIYYSIKDLNISDINPYSKYYVAAQFINGKVFFENQANIVNNRLKSTNHLVIQQVRCGNKPKGKSLYELPIKLAVVILRNPKGDIDLTIPVEGDLNDPNYKLGKVIWQVFKNLIVKAATAPYNLLAVAFGGKESDYKEIQFQYLQYGVSEDQYSILNNIINVLNEKPSLGLELVQSSNRRDEIEFLAVFKAKKSYLGISGGDSLSETEHASIDKLSVKDSLFVSWINSKVQNTSLKSTQDKCIEWAGREKLQAEVDTMMSIRNRRLSEYFMAHKIEPARLQVHNIAEDQQPETESIPRYLMNYFPVESSK